MMPDLKKTNWQSILKFVWKVTQIIAKEILKKNKSGDSGYLILWGTNKSLNQDNVIGGSLGI